MSARAFFDHTNPDGLDPFQRMAAVGYAGRTMGENIAAGQPSPESVMAGWMASDGHCANIMRGSFTEIGIGYFTDGGGGGFGRGYTHFWTQNFGSPGGRGF
jgi:uncharacterized protein YkwD